MSYISLSDKDKREMLALLGISSAEELFASIPDEIRLKRDLFIPKAMTEPELEAFFENLAGENEAHRYLSFLGAGAYPHVIPYLVDYLSSRGEFISPYTPYQAEVSQGTLQVIFEFQTLICQLTGMEIANASLYDGASGAAEAVLMAHRLKNKPKILVARSLHPEHKRVIRTYTQNLGIALEEVGFTRAGKLDREDLHKRFDGGVSAVVLQSPNYLGVIEELTPVSDIAHGQDALSVVVVAEAMSLGILEPPGNSGADIVAGEGQSFGLPLSFGGPYLGFMSCRKEFIRQFPGRISGQTVDVEGKRGYVLTLSTREQHIRREKATSNICTNQALCALRATLFLETVGREGLRDLAWCNVQKANYALEKCLQIKGIKRRLEGSVFNEFVLEFTKPWPEISSSLKKEGILGGRELSPDYPDLENCVLFCVTETHSKANIDRLIDALHKAA